MTAEITVMNRQGVALAADSAVTVSSADGRMTSAANKTPRFASVEQVREAFYPEDDPTLPYFWEPAPETRHEVVDVPVETVVSRVLRAGRQPAT